MVRDEPVPPLLCVSLCGLHGALTLSALWLFSAAQMLDSAPPSSISRLPVR
jgi:hypothetical protein